VSFIGLVESAPHSKSLVEVVRQCVPEIEIPWLKEVRESKYLPVKINAIETFAAVSKKGLT
jgi:ribonuclease P/MRP protein subunit POP3